MATSRKHWFKVADSVLREDWSDSTLATHVRLMAWLNQRWARDGIDHEKAGSAVIGAVDAMAITGSKRPHVALQRLASHPLVAGYRSASASLDDDQRPTRVTLRWPKFSIFQEYGSRSPGSRFPVDAPPGTDSDSGTGTEEELPPGAAPPRPPEELPSGDELERLAERDHRPLANCLAKLDGDPEEKRLWLESGVGGQILAAADEELPASATSRQRSGFLVRVTMQRWNAYLKTDRPFRTAATIEQLDAQRARQPPAQAPLPDLTPEEFQELMAKPHIAGMFDSD